MNLKHVISLVVASVVSFAAGGTIIGLHVKKKYEKQCERAINDVRKYYRDAYEKKEQELVQKKIEDYKAIEVEKQEEEEIPFDIPLGGPVKAASDAIMKSFDEINNTYIEESSYIYQVSAYDTGDLGEYETETYYYHPNGDLTDEEGNTVITSSMNVGDLLEGAQILKELRSSGEVYIRNDHIQIDFEIVYQTE